MKEQVSTVVLLGLVTSRRLSWIASDWSGAARTKFAQGKKKEHEGKRWSTQEHSLGGDQKRAQRQQEG